MKKKIVSVIIMTLFFNSILGMSEMTYAGWKQKR